MGSTGDPRCTSMEGNESENKIMEDGGPRDTSEQREGIHGGGGDDWP